MNTNPHPHKFRGLTDDELVKQIAIKKKEVAELQSTLHRMEMENRRRRMARENK